MDRLKTYTTAFLSNHWVQYFLFWMLCYFVLTKHFSYDGTIKKIDLIYTGLFMLSIWGAVIINSFALIPRLLAHKRNVGYLGLITLTMLGATWFNILTYEYLSDWLFPDYYFISYFEWYQILQYILAFTGITTLLQLSRSWFREAEMQQSLAEIKEEKIATELKALRAQINPHFLFNSLNHIYALAVKKSSQTAPAVLQLSELLRYAIQRMNHEKVPLEEEIEYLEKFVALYKSRTHHPERVHFSVTGSPKNLTIAPLLLVVFVENCFKHGSTPLKNDSIDISLSIEEQKLRLQTKNRISQDHELPKISNGLGLENVRRRLVLLYENKYNLDIKRNDRFFEVDLELELL
ncbi:sensor histidine kinase [Fodinibius saliphilus]|uniref:sensor histidine kinase n=1 Tax=Fodinibius saliphilus TaxID=1920650 RepID=UPI001109684F|nr:histidine kinase [Fodinibius saliphilus]